MTNEWRRAVAALANPATRRVFAAIVLNQQPDASGPRLERALVALRNSGLVATLDDGSTVAIDDAFARLLAENAPVTRHGIERFVADGRIESFPSRPADRLEVLEWAARQVPDGASLTERELTELLGTLADDAVTLRRYLVDAGLLSRTADGSAYRRTM